MNNLPVRIAPNIRDSVDSHIRRDERLYRNDYQKLFLNTVVATNIEVRTRNRSRLFLEKVTAIDFYKNELLVGLRDGTLMSLKPENLAKRRIPPQITIPFNSDVKQVSAYLRIAQTDSYICRVSPMYDSPRIGSTVKWVTSLYKNKSSYCINEEGKIYRIGGDDWFKFCPELDTSIVSYELGPIQNCFHLQTDTDDSFALIQWKNQYALIYGFHEITEIKVLDRDLFDISERDYIFKVYDENVFYAPIEATATEIHSVFIKRIKGLSLERRAEIVLYGDKLKTFEVNCQRLVCITFDNYIETYDTVTFNRMTLISTHHLTTDLDLKPYEPRLTFVLDALKGWYEGVDKILIFATESGNLISIEIEQQHNTNLCCAECAPKIIKHNKPIFNKYICFHYLPQVDEN